MADPERRCTVPGTHRRATTAAERRVLTWPTAASEQDPEMPGRMVVNLAPGEAVYYHSSMFHRGVYPRSACVLTDHTLS